MKLISVLQLGTVDYLTALCLQERLVALRKDGRVPDVVLLLEHTPVITLGRNAQSKNILAAPELLVQRGVEVHECDRGGDVTFHGPGQLVAYPIFDLRGWPAQTSAGKTLGAVEYVRRLEEILIRTCADFGIATTRIPGLTGVWTDRGDRHLLSGGALPSSAGSVKGEHGIAAHPAAKIAALGVHISRGVTSHGVALNVNTDLRFFDLIVPCGISSRSVTSMAKELNRTLRLQEVAHRFSRNMGAVFSSQVLWLDSLDALLGNNLGIPMRTPENLRQMHGGDDSALG
jgi:lipoyl(octanoyl) transferase